LVAEYEADEVVVEARLHAEAAADRGIDLIVRSDEEGGQSVDILQDGQPIRGHVPVAGVCRTFLPPLMKIEVHAYAVVEGLVAVAVVDQDPTVGILLQPRETLEAPSGPGEAVLLADAEAQLAVPI